jgi:hypothetical protein
VCFATATNLIHPKMCMCVFVCLTYTQKWDRHSTFRKSTQFYISLNVNQLLMHLHLWVATPWCLLHQGGLHLIRYNKNLYINVWFLW